MAHDGLVEGKLVHRSVSITDVAREAGVSKATVSHWLNARTGKVSAETRRRLDTVAERLGYRPMLGARRLTSHALSGTVALLVRRDLGSVFADPYFTKVMEGVNRVFSSLGTRGLVVTSPPSPEEDTEYLLSLARGIVDGFLVFDIEDHDRTLAAFVRHRVPFVAVGQPEGDLLFPWVATDHAGAVAHAVGWLADRGHRQIALESGPETLLLHRHRARGYREAMTARGLETAPRQPTAVLCPRWSPDLRGPEVVLLDGPGPAECS